MYQSIVWSATTRTPLPCHGNDARHEIHCRTCGTSSRDMKPRCRDVIDPVANDAPKRDAFDYQESVVTEVTGTELSSVWEEHRVSPTTGSYSKRKEQTGNSVSKEKNRVITDKSSAVGHPPTPHSICHVLPPLFVFIVCVHKVNANQ